MTRINTEEAPKAIGPYSQAVISGGMLYVSGQIPVNPKTGEIPLTIEEQTKQSLENVKSIIKEAKSDMKNVVRCTVYIKDMNDFPKINEVYSSYFSEPYPARACIEVARLPKDVQIEIDAIVEIPN